MLPERRTWAQWFAASWDQYKARFFATPSHIAWFVWSSYLGLLSATLGALSGANANTKLLIKEQAIDANNIPELMKWRLGAFAILMAGALWFAKQYAVFTFNSKYPTSRSAARRSDENCCGKFFSIVGSGFTSLLKTEPNFIGYALISFVFMSQAGSYSISAFIALCYFISQFGVANHNGVYQVRRLFDSLGSFLLGMSSFIGGIGSVGLVGFSFVLLERMIRDGTLTPQIDYTESSNAITAAVAFAFSVLIGTVQGAAYAVLRGFEGFAHPVFNNIFSIGILSFFKAWSVNLGAANAIVSWANIPTTLWSVIVFTGLTLLATGKITKQQWDYVRYQFSLALGEQGEARSLLANAAVDEESGNVAASNGSQQYDSLVIVAPVINLLPAEEPDEDDDAYQESWCNFFARQAKRPITWARSCCGPQYIFGLQP